MKKPIKRKKLRPGHYISLIFDLLSKRRKQQLGILTVLAVIAAIAELLTIGAVLPLINFVFGNEISEGTALSYIRERIPAFAFLLEDRILILLVFIGVVSLAATFRLLLSWFLVRFAQGVGADLTKRIFEGIINQPYRYHTSTNSSEIIAIVSKIESVGNSVINMALEAASSTIISLAIFIGLIALDWKIALSSVLTFSCIYAALSLISARRVIGNSHIQSASASKRIQTIQEALGAIRDIILNQKQAVVLARIQKYDAEYRKANAANSLWGQLPRFFLEAIGMTMIAVVAMYAFNNGADPTAALSKLAALAVGAQKLLPLLQRAYSSWTIAIGNMGNLKDVSKMVKLQIPAVPQGDPSAKPLRFEREIRLCNIGFRYNDTSPWIFRNINLVIKKGSRIGIAGETGCGKSTLLDIIMGLQRPTEGEIFIDDILIDSRTTTAWQKNISHVPQNIFLLDATIMENIAFGDPINLINIERFQIAVEKAKVSDFIGKLELEHYTVVGERGIRFSGGQKQRIGIARALYNNAKVIVFDEATNALDETTECDVLTELKSLSDDVTQISVSHRRTTLESCDKMYLLSLGYLSEIGISSKEQR